MWPLLITGPATTTRISPGWLVSPNTVHSFYLYPIWLFAKLLEYFKTRLHPILLRIKAKVCTVAYEALSFPPCPPASSHHCLLPSNNSLFAILWICETCSISGLLCLWFPLPGPFSTHSPRPSPCLISYVLFILALVSSSQWGLPM